MKTNRKLFEKIAKAATGTAAQIAAGGINAAYGFMPRQSQISVIPNQVQL